MPDLNRINPFSKRESYSRGEVVAYKVLTLASWLLSAIASVYSTIGHDGASHPSHHTIWYLNHVNPTPFTLSPPIIYIYWAALLVLQLGYISHLFSDNIDHLNPACAVGGHFILNNLLHFAFIVLFTQHHSVWAEVVLILNFINLSSLYFRHNTYPRFIHAPTVTGPLAWTFVAIYWNGAIMLDYTNTQIARIFANIFIWSILAYGWFFLVAYKDYTMGFALSVLAASLGVGQFRQQVVALQWIFAFTIMAALFVSTALVAGAAWAGKDIGFRRRAPVADQERAPLLADNTA